MPALILIATCIVNEAKLDGKKRTGKEWDREKKGTSEGGAVIHHAVVSI
jgi:hypothetical protein